MSEPTQIEVSIPYATILRWLLQMFPELDHGDVRLVNVTDSYRGSIRFTVERVEQEPVIEETPEC